MKQFPPGKKVLRPMTVHWILFSLTTPFAMYIMWLMGEESVGLLGYCLCVCFGILELICIKLAFFRKPVCTVLPEGILVGRGLILWEHMAAWRLEEDAEAIREPIIHPDGFPLMLLVLFTTEQEAHPPIKLKLYLLHWLDRKFLMEELPAHGVARLPDLRPKSLFSKRDLDRY